MLSTLSSVLNGLSQSVSRATQSANNIVNASSKGQNIDGDMVNLKIANTEVAMNAAVVKTQKKMQDALLDIEV